jgi:hypothetical protein
MVARYRRMPHGRLEFLVGICVAVTGLLQSYAPHKLRNCGRRKLGYCGATKAFELCAPPLRLSNCERAFKRIFEEFDKRDRGLLWNRHSLLQPQTTNIVALLTRYFLTRIADK